MQVFRTFNGKKEGIPNPIQQAERQKILFQRWLARHMNKTIPVHTLISISLPSTIIETSDRNEQLFKKVLHAEHIPDRISHLIKTHPTQSLTSYQIKKICTLLAEQDSPHFYDALTFYKISPADLITGIPCPTCMVTPMMRVYGKWKCQGCHTTSIDAHERVIIDHLLLQQKITNRECQTLLGIDDKHLIKRILASMDLPYKGEGKNRYYYLELSSQGASSSCHIWVK
jgi:hypothetical protein